MINSDLEDAIESYLSTHSIKKLKKDFQHISQSYRQLDCKLTGHSKDDVDAYLVGRLPLTYAVIKDVLEKNADYLPQGFSVTDYGCGPATALFALHDVFEDFKYQGLEEKKAMLDAAQYLSKNLGIEAQFFQSDVLQDKDVRTDLGMASYLLNELDDPFSFYKLLLDRHEFILILEPGTPDGFKRINKLRQLAIESKWHVIAPCSHDFSCPMLSSQSWCHFYTRVARTKKLKGIKDAQLGYEDEKYSYLFLSKNSTPQHKAVLLAEPIVFPFKVDATICDADGQIKEQSFLKKDKDNYKRAKKLSWGDFI